MKLALVAFVLFGVPAVMANSGGPSPGYTGAPGEFTCRQCHTTNPLNDGVGSITIEGVPASYALGASYTLTIRVQHPDRRRWGFQLTALTGALDPAGTFTIVDGVHTQLKTDDGKTYVEHRTAGTYAGTAGGASWNVKWTAPSTSIGPVDFYAAGNAANNNSNDTGDNIYATFATAAAPTISTPFVDITGPAGLLGVTGGRAIAWADFDSDGDDDVLIVRDGDLQLFENGGGVFADLSGSLGLSAIGDARAAAWGDANGDGRPDLALAGDDAPHLYLNTAAGFVDATGPSGIPVGPASVVAWVDYNRDDRPDLFVGYDSGARLLRQASAGVFEDATAESGLPSLTGLKIAACADANGDGLVDLVVSATGGTMLFRQGLDGRFTDVTAAAGLDPDTGGATDLAWADYDGDARPDLFAATAAGLRVFRNTGAMSFEDATASSGLSAVACTSLALDDSNGDGHIDLLVVQPTGVRLKQYQSSGFVDETESAGITSVIGIAASWADIDNDSHVDLLVIGDDGATLRKNPSIAPSIAVTLENAAGHVLTGGTVSLDEDDDFATGSQQMRILSGGGSSAQPPARACFSTPQPRTVLLRSVFPNGSGRDLSSTTGTSARIGALQPNLTARIDSVVFKRKNGTDKLQLNGLGFATGSERVEVDGVPMATTKYPMAHRLTDGTSDRINGIDGAFGSLVPHGREVIVTTLDPATGVRSVPRAFTRP